MKPTPRDWPRMSSSVFYENPAAAIDWLVRAFGFEVRIKIEGEGGRIEHSELTFGDAVIMVGGTSPGSLSPRTAGGCTGALFIYVDDADAHEAQARAAGATITRPVTTTDDGAEWWVDRGYGCTDLEGHLWHFAHRVKDAPQKPTP